MPTTPAEQLEQILRRLPPRYSASEAILAGGASQIAQLLNVTDDLTATSLFGGADGAWLDLHAKSYGLLRSSGETDAALRERLRSIGASVTRSAILDAVDALLVARGTAVPAQMIEFFDRNTVLATLVVAFSFIVTRSYVVGRLNSFILIVPDFGDLTDEVYGSIISEVNRIRGAGIRWSLIVTGAP